jgi:hypothetical protein
MGRKAQRKMHDPKGMAILGLKEASRAVLGPFNPGIVATEQAFKDNAAAPGHTLAISVLTEQCDTETVRLLEWAFMYEKSWAVPRCRRQTFGRMRNCSRVGSQARDRPVRFEHGRQGDGASSIIRLTLKPETRQAEAE